MGFVDSGGGFSPSLCLLLVVSGVLWGAWGFPLHLLAIVPPELTHQVSRALRKSLIDIDRMPGRDVALLASVSTLGNNTRDVITTLCDSLKPHNPSLLLTFLDPSLTFYVSLITGYARLPHLGFRSGYLDSASKEMNSMYLSLDPTAEEIADATYHFLNANGWYHVTFLTDDSQFSCTIYRRFSKYIRNSPWTKPQRILLDRTDNGTKIFHQITDVHRSKTRVFVIHCDSSILLTVLREAAKLNLLDGEWIWVFLDSSPNEHQNTNLNSLPIGLLSLRPRFHSHNRQTVRSVVELIAEVSRTTDWDQWAEDYKNLTVEPSCWFNASEERWRLSTYLYRSMKTIKEGGRTGTLTAISRQDKPIWPEAVIDILNLISGPRGQNQWKTVGNITGSKFEMNTVVWLGETRTGPRPTGRQRFRVVTAYAPPFVKPSTKITNGTCLTGVKCLQVSTNNKTELLQILANYKAEKSEGSTYNVTCCSGISIDLLESVARDLKFDFDVYLVADGVFGSNRGQKWNGITADLISGAAHLTFSAFSMTSQRSRVIDFSVPYFHSGVSFLLNSQYREVPLSAFLVPFSYQLWVAIFASLNLTAIFAAIYEWHSPFGLNPWGRQRTKNFSLASALWVMWSLLFSHLVAFKAPKSWPNKVLINLWGCFSVIFVSSYTANIAALFAGLFFQLRVDDFHDASLLHQRTGTAKSSAAEGYVYAENPRLWQHIQKFGVNNLEEGLEMLRKSELDVLIGDTAVLNYFRGNDPICGLLLGDSIFDDAYAIGMQKGFPLRDDISNLILRYNEFGYLDQLQKKWYGRVPCFNDSVHRLNKPKPLGVGAVAGVFIMLGVGHLVGILILFIEHMVFKYALPILRKKPDECIWKNLNLMFFSQKLYRFINTVELVSPHHSAKEIATNLREGQIFSLFQKSVKRKAKEEARRRKSKSQFFEMIQEIRKVVRQQQHEIKIGATRMDQQPRLGIQTHTTEPKTLDNRDALIVHHNDSIPKLKQVDVHKPSPKMRNIVAEAYRSNIVSSYSLEYDDNLLTPSNSSTSNDTSPSEWHGFSFSFEDLSTLHSEEPQRTRLIRKKCRVSSLEDLRILKKTSFNRDEYVNEKHKKPLKQRSKEINELRLYSMTKEEIICLWQASERVLLNRLREVLREKKALEEKLAFIQKTLLKPP
ncbi:glutamate receptor ionotropic, NMDA 3A-like isoform X2 [Centruroides vittatus]|uniref:glutamate receptor ionotropic, NMDA 3A-like isoform X2 n=1 Tax=Centruroides vittatus TaxID=120091 RepID=UPI00350F95CD